MAGRALEEGVFVISRQKGHISLCSYLQILTASAFHPHIPPAQLRTHLCREKNHLLLWRRGCCLCCRSQLLWNLFSMFVGTAVLLSKFPHNLWVLLQVERVSTWVGNARTNTPELRMASTSHLLLVSSWVVKLTKMGTEVSCFFCVSEGMTPLVTSYCGRQSIEKLTAQPYVMVIDWLLISLPHTVQSVQNVLMSSFYLFLFFSFGTLSTSEQLKHIRLCIACNIQGLSSVFVKHKNHFFATVYWDKVRPSS